MRAEPGGAQLPFVPEERHRARIDCATERFLCDGDGGAAHADRLHSVAVREIAVGRERGPGGEARRGKREAEGGKLSWFHGVPLLVIGNRCSALGWARMCQMNRLTSASFAIGRNEAAPTYSLTSGMKSEVL